MLACCYVFFFQAEDGIRDAQESRGLGDVYKRQTPDEAKAAAEKLGVVVVKAQVKAGGRGKAGGVKLAKTPDEAYLHCLLYTSDAADDLLCVDLGGRRIIKKKKNRRQTLSHTNRNKNTYMTI